jgi:hypothetical protein
MADKGWQRAFEEPISLSGGGKLVTLHDAATYATGLSKENAATAGWKAAMEALLLVAEHGGPTMFARIGMMRALHRNKRKAASTPRQKRPKAYRVIR